MLILSGPTKISDVLQKVCSDEKIVAKELKDWPFLVPKANEKLLFKEMRHQKALNETYTNAKSTENQCFCLVAGTGLEPVTFGL